MLFPLQLVPAPLAARLSIAAVTAHAIEIRLERAAAGLAEDLLHREDARVAHRATPAAFRIASSFSIRTADRPMATAARPRAQLPANMSRTVSPTRVENRISVESSPSGFSQGCTRL